MTNTHPKASAKKESFSMYMVLGVVILTMLGVLAWNWYGADAVNRFTVEEFVHKIENPDNAVLQRGSTYIIVETQLFSSPRVYNLSLGDDPESVFILIVDENRFNSGWGRGGHSAIHMNGWALHDDEKRIAKALEENKR